MTVITFNTLATFSVEQGILNVHDAAEAYADLYTDGEGLQVLDMPDDVPDLGGTPIDYL